MNKKKLLSLALVVIMIAILSFSTLAWFNDNDSVKNEFFVATTEDGDNTDPDDIFSVDLWEPVDEDGDGVISDEEKDQDGLEFENITPGATYDKAPTVENTGAYTQWIRLIVTTSDANAWVEILGDDYDLTSIFLGHDEGAWTLSHEPVQSGDNLTYVYYLNAPLEPGKTATLFEQVQLPGELTQHDLAKLAGSFELSIQADAVQYDNIPAVTAKEAFAYVGWPAGSAYPAN